MRLELASGPAGRRTRLGRLPFCVAALLLVTACRTVLPPPEEPGPSRPPAQEAIPAPRMPAPDTQSVRSRQQAAETLTANGRQELDQGRPDAALRLFEQAVALSPHYGPGHYYLAEAWLAKGNAPQAREFHRLAALYLEKVPGWQTRLADQARRLSRAPGTPLP
jgi:tetratricopeptide (TPR) repeat protein